MDGSTIITKGAAHLETLVGSEIVLMELEDGRFYSLSGTGRRVWELIDGATSIDSLADRLTGEFAVARETCMADLLRLCGELQSRKLIDVASPVHS